jgi:hypothetical protein
MENVAQSVTTTSKRTMFENFIGIVLSSILSGFVKSPSRLHMELFTVPGKGFE